MILESIVTTADAAGAVNIAPMGPEVDAGALAAGRLAKITLKPFRSSRTFANLWHSGRAVVHLTDDVELMAAAAIGSVDPAAPVQPLLDHWHRLVDCCHWFAVEVEAWHDDRQRPQAVCRIVHRGVERPMLGLNRAKHAVVEAAILATRLDRLGRQQVRAQMEALRPLVEKTGGAAERRAWQRLERFVDG